MTEKLINTTIEILGKFYPIRCKEPEVNSLQETAKYLNEQMLMVQESGKVINLERIAIVTALNIAQQFLEIKKQHEQMTSRLNQRLTQLQHKLDDVLNKSLQTEFAYIQK